MTRILSHPFFSALLLSIQSHWLKTFDVHEMFRQNDEVTIDGHQNCSHFHLDKTETNQG